MLHRVPLPIFNERLCREDDWSLNPDNRLLKSGLGFRRALIKGSVNAGSDQFKQEL
jgi:hypothetical protein